MGLKYIRYHSVLLCFLSPKQDRPDLEISNITKRCLVFGQADGGGRCSILDRQDVTGAVTVFGDVDVLGGGQSDLITGIGDRGCG